MNYHEGVRELDKIQESDASSGRFSSLSLFALAGSILIVAGLLFWPVKKEKVAESKLDPLSSLIALQKENKPKSVELKPEEVSFPSTLSDKSNPTTSMAAVKGKDKVGENSQTATRYVEEGLSPDKDRISVGQLPAKNVLQSSALIGAPKDDLTKVAVTKSDTKSIASEGKEGKYILQVSSFRSKKEADEFAKELRERGHHAFVQEANVEGRGQWFRVRVGPFDSQLSASKYRQEFEKKEHVVPFLVNPEKDRAEAKKASEQVKKPH